MSWGCSPASAVSGASRTPGSSLPGLSDEGPSSHSDPRLVQADQRPGSGTAGAWPGLLFSERRHPRLPSSLALGSACSVTPRPPGRVWEGGVPELAEHCLPCCQTPGRVQGPESRETRSAHSFIDSPAFSRKPSRWLSLQSSRGAAEGLRPSRLPMVIPPSPASAHHLSTPSCGSPTALRRLSSPPLATSVGYKESRRGEYRAHQPRQTEVPSWESLRRTRRPRRGLLRASACLSSSATTVTERVSCQ